jgi:hypothetical protein
MNKLYIAQRRYEIRTPRNAYEYKGETEIRYGQFESVSKEYTSINAFADEVCAKPCKKFFIFPAYEFMTSDEYNWTYTTIRKDKFMYGIITDIKAEIPLYHYTMKELLHRLPADEFMQFMKDNKDSLDITKLM